MKTITIILIILMLATVSYAGSGKYAWDSSYVLGACLLNTSLMYSFDMPFIQASITTMACSMVKESLDMMYTHGMIHRNKYLDLWLDPYNSADKRDIKLCAYGVGLSLISVGCNKLFSNKTFMFNVKPSSLYISIYVCFGSITDKANLRRKERK